VPLIRRRLLVALIVAIVAGLVPLGSAGSLLVHSLVGFILGGLAFAVPLLAHILGHDAPATREKVAGRDGDAAWYDVVVIIVGLASLYTLRYARLYYASPTPPIDFNQSEDPQFSDFAYFSFNLGMAYQVSDTNLRSSEVRRVVLGHTLLAYLYGTIIIASTINLVVGIGGSI
jgi:uncharacterized membrane protein